MEYYEIALVELLILIVLYVVMIVGFVMLSQIQANIKKLPIGSIYHADSSSQVNAVISIICITGVVIPCYNYFITIDEDNSFRKFKAITLFYVTVPLFQESKMKEIQIILGI